MANFCTKCGKALADGEVCSCQSATQINPAQQAPQGQFQQAPQGQFQQAPQGQQFQQPQQPSAAGLYFKDLFKTSIDTWVAPATKGKEFVKSGKFGVAIGILVAQALAAMLLGICFEARKDLATVAEYMGGSSVPFTYFKVVFGTLFFSAAFSVMLAALILAFNAIAKNKMNFKQALCLAAVRGVILIPAMGVALLFVLIHPVFGAIVTIVINIYGIIAMIKALPVEEGVSENLLVHLMSAAIGIFAIVSLSLMLSLGGLLYASMNYLARM